MLETPSTHPEKVDTVPVYGVLSLGMIEYGRALHLQEKLHQRRVAGEISNTLILLEHPPVLTLGSSGKPENILLPIEELERAGFTIHKIGRGGDITYHGPGQLVGYPIIDLRERGRDISRFIWEIEEVIIQLLRDYDIRGERLQGLRGVWVNNKKICAIGVQVRRWVTMHGFAFNINTNLDHFGYIVPCGISDKGVTSLSHILGYHLIMGEVIDKVIYHFKGVFGVSLKTTDLAF